MHYPQKPAPPAQGEAARSGGARHLRAVPSPAAAPLTAAQAALAEVLADILYRDLCTQAPR